MARKEGRGRGGREAYIVVSKLPKLFVPPNRKKRGDKGGRESTSFFIH